MKPIYAKHMNAKPIIATLHGSGGSKADFSLLQKELPHFEWHHFNPSENTWIDFVRTQKQKVHLVSFSFAASQVIHHFNQVFDNIERVYLINPFVKTEKALSVIARTLLSLPVLGEKLISSNHQKSYQDFIHRVAHPEKVNSRPEYSVALKHASELSTWREALQNKISLQSLNLCKPTHSPLGFVYWGSQDQVMNNEIQKSTINEYVPYLKSMDFPDGGHNLIWTQYKHIAKDIEMSANKIGYHAGEKSENNVISYMVKHEKEYGERIAIRWADPAGLKQWSGQHQDPIPHREINFKDFSKRISCVANGLLKLGVNKGDRVIIFLPMSLDMYVSMFAVQKIGAIAVFLDSWARSHHLGASAECVGPKAMISFEKAFELVDQVPEFQSMPIRIGYGPGTRFHHKFDDLLKSEPLETLEPVESEFTALITFTTGSTGKPKGANRTHRFLSAQHHALSHVIPYKHNDVDMPAFPIFSLNSLATGVTTLLPALDLAQPSPRDPAILACQILQEKVNCTTLSPSMLVGLSRYCKEHGLILTGLRRAVTGGAPISRDDVKAFYEIAPQSELWILYGSTEAEPMAHIEGRNMLKESQQKDSEIVEEGVNVGEISEDIDYKFIKIVHGAIKLDQNKKWSDIEVANGEVGEFICTGDHVCREYYNNPEAFLSTKIMGDDGRVWHRTGDLAYIDSHKDLWIVGRVNNAIERKGKYYFPVRAEVLLKRMEFTHRCAFLGLPDSETQQTCAAVELKHDLDLKSFDFAKAKKEIQRVFEKNKIPVDQIHFVKAVPMDPRHHSKVEYGILRKMLLEDKTQVVG